MPVKKRSKAPAKRKKARATRVIRVKKTKEPKPKILPVIPGLPVFPVKEESKFYAEPEEKNFELPHGYGDNRIVLMVRDPHWAYAYWETKDQRQEKILRIYDTENWSSFDIEITGGARNWYIRMPAPNRTYCVEIGYKSPDGKFVAVARSNWVTMPLDRMSDVIDEQWMTPDWDWEKIYALSGGFGVGRGSEEIREMMQKRFQEESASGWIFSRL